VRLLMKSEEFVNRSYRAMSSMDPFCLFDSCLSLSLSFLMINVFFRNRYRLMMLNRIRVSVGVTFPPLFIRLVM